MDIGFIISSAIRLLDSFISNEVASINDLPDNARAIKETFISISTFLKSVEDTAEGDSSMKDWVKQVRILAYDLEDIIEEYQLYREKKWLGRIYDYLNRHVRDMEVTMKSLRNSADNIGGLRDSFGSNNSTGQCSSSSLNSQSTVSTISIIENRKLVGAEFRKDGLYKKLFSIDTQYTVVAVFGKKGVGKTSLVRSIYNDLGSHTGGNKYHRAWIRVPRSKDAADVYRNILKQFFEANNDIDATKRYVEKISYINAKDLLPRIGTCMQKRRYMIVFDNVQDQVHLNTVIKVKEELLEYNLTSNEAGSKLLMITSNKQLALDWLHGMSDKRLYELHPLLQKEAWELFCKETFQRCGGKCPPELEKLAKEIVEKCEGLPAAILPMSRLLSTKVNSKVEWKKVATSLGYFLENNSHLKGIYGILTRKYYDLPSHLKPCFLYFGLFPVDNPVDKMKILRLWIAEGFIVPNRSNNLTLEDIAEDYLKELIVYNLLEVYEDRIGRVKTLRVPAFLHEIILSMSEELCFCQVLSERYSTANDKPRRLSVQKQHSEHQASQVLKSIIKNKSSIRCLFLFEPAIDMVSMVLTKEFLESIRLLKVLDLSDASISELPKSVGELLNLRYLSLRNTRVQKLPSSVGNLVHLQTLDLKQTPIRNIPTELNKLHKLRYLLSYEYESGSSSYIQKLRGVKIPEGVLKTSRHQLHTLAFVDVGQESKVIIGELGNLTQLRRLGIIGLKPGNGKYLCAAIRQMKYLLTLNVYSDNQSEHIDLEHLQSPPETLEHLCLNGPLKSFPSWIFNLNNLSRICLRYSNLDDSNPFENLQRLPNLLEVQLLEAYNGENLKFRDKGFQKLKILHLLDLPNLKHASILKGALPLLEELLIGKSPNLKVPSGIKYLNKLKILKFFDMPEKFTSYIRSCEKDNYYSDVQNRLEVFLCIKRDNGSWQDIKIRGSRPHGRNRN